MADQVMLLREGRVEQDAPPDELYARPATAFAARFIGTPPMNRRSRSTTRRRLLRASRPEDIRVALGRRARRRSEAAGAESVEYLGADSILMCAIGGRRWRCAPPAASRSPPARP